MAARVSLASPRSIARTRGHEQAFARRAGSAAIEERLLRGVARAASTHWPSRPRDGAASAAAAISASDSPASSDASVMTTAPSLAAASNWFVNRAPSDGFFLVERLESGLVGVGQSGARHARTADAEPRAAAAIPDRASADRAPRKDGIDAREQRRIQTRSHPHAPPASGRCLPAAAEARRSMLARRARETHAARASSVSPLRSSATSVFSNVGGSARFAIASISAMCSACASSNAGAKSASVIRSKGGAQNGRGLGVRRGFDTATTIPDSGAHVPSASPVAGYGLRDRPRLAPRPSIIGDRDREADSWTMSGSSSPRFFRPAR